LKRIYTDGFGKAAGEDSGINVISVSRLFEIERRIKFSLSASPSFANLANAQLFKQIINFKLLDKHFIFSQKMDSITENEICVHPPQICVNLR
jgi:hypothetical protein